MPSAAKSRRNWSSTTSASVPTTSSCVVSDAAICGTNEARQASSPWVKVVSMPLPE